MQMGRAEYESVESLLLTLTKCSAADIAKCPPNLIEEARYLLQSVTVPSPAPPPRPRDAEGLEPITVPSPVSSPGPQDEEGLAPTTVSEHVQVSSGHTGNPVDANTATQQIAATKLKGVSEALFNAIKKTKNLLKHGGKTAVRDHLSPTAYDPRVQDLEATLQRPSQKLRHVLVLPIWLCEYEGFCVLGGRGSLRQFASKRGLSYEAAREAVDRSRKLRHITSYYGEPGLRLLLAFTVSKWRRLSDESLEGVARLCQKDSSFTESVPALSKFYEECEAEYAVLLGERLATVLQPIKSIRLAWGTRPDRISSQMHPKQVGGFVEETEVEESPIGEGQYGFVRGHEDTRLSTGGSSSVEVGNTEGTYSCDSIEGGPSDLVDCELHKNSTTVARENQHGTKRSFQVFEKGGGGDQKRCESDTARLEQRESMPQSGSVMARTATSSEAPIDNSRASNHDPESVASVNPEDDPGFLWFDRIPGIDPSFSFDFEGIDADPAFTTNDLWR